MSNKIDVDPKQLAQLSQHHTSSELAQIFGCGITTIQTRLKKIGVKPANERKKETRKATQKKFSPRVREILMENCL